MTIKVTISQASQQFSQLLNSVLQGEEIIICENSDNGIPIAQITAIHQTKQKRIPGQDRDKIVIAPDFNAPLPDNVLADFIN